MPERRALQLSRTPEGRLSVTGSGVLEVNGMKFEAWASLDDPRYAFGVSAAGMRFDLADSLRVMVPTVPAAQVFGAAALRDLADGVSSLGAAFDEAGPLTAPVVPGLPGDAPEFSLAMERSPFAALEAWADAESSDARLGVQRDYRAVTSAMNGALGALIAKMDSWGQPAECADRLTLREAKAAVAFMLKAERALAVRGVAPSAPLSMEISNVRNRITGFLNCVLSQPQSLDVEFENDLFELIRTLLMKERRGPALPADLATLLPVFQNYILVSLQTRLDQSGLNPSTGALAIAPEVFNAMSLERNSALLSNMMTRQQFLQIYGMDESMLPYAPGVMAADVLHEALRSIYRARRHGLVMESRELLASQPSAREFATPAGYVQPGHPVIGQAREHGRRVRNVTAFWLELHYFELLTGIVPDAAEILPHVLDEDRAWDAELESVNRAACLNRLFAAENPDSPLADLIISTVAFKRPDGSIVFPTGSLALLNDVNVFDSGGFKFDVLGGVSCGPGQPATAVTVAAPLQDQSPRVTIAGAVRFKVASSVLTKEPGTGDTAPGLSPTEVGVAACGSITLFPDRPPAMQWARAELSGRFKIGNAIRVDGLQQGQLASLTLDGVQNLFHPSSVSPFTVILNGRIKVPDGPGFGLGDTKFIFTSLQNPPQIQPGTATYDGSDWTLAQRGAIQIEQASLRFKNGALPLDQLFRPENLEISGTVVMGLPTVADSVVGGRADDVKVNFTSDGVPLFSLDGIGFEIGDFDIPPISDLGGKLYIGGLSDPSRLMFAGRVTGVYQTYKLTWLLALSAQGPLGCCLDVNAGNVGIPLAQTTLLITGASGGYTFMNNSGDPCGFQTYLGTNAGGFVVPRPNITPPLPTMSWADFSSQVTKIEREIPQFGGGAGAAAQAPAPRIPRGFVGGIDCPEQCPPPTVNIFCQPHPDEVRFPGRIILKFTSINEDTLNNVFNISEETVRQWIAGNNDLALTAGQELRDVIDQNTPDPDPSLLGQDFADTYTGLLNRIQTGFTTALDLALDASVDQGAPALYAVIRDTVYSGLPCPDMTLMMSGTMTQMAVASFMNVTGKAIVSTTGCAGVSGHVNLLGVHVGTGKLFVNATDSQGELNPSICGEVEVEFGPFEVGTLIGELNYGNAYTFLLPVIPEIAAALGPVLTARILHKIDPAKSGQSLEQVLAGMNEKQAITFATGFMAEMMQLPPGDLPATFANTAAAAVAGAMENVHMQFAMCGEVAPKIFGIPMGNSIGAARFQAVVEGSIFHMEGDLELAPIAALLAANNAATLPLALLTNVEKARVGFAYEAAGEMDLLFAGFAGHLSSPERAAAFARQRIAHMLEHSTAIFAYDLKPLGISLARANGRIMMPDFTDHPVLRQGGWRRPEDRGLPSRLALVQAALRENKLAQASWKGKAGDLPAVFPNDPAAQAALGDKTLTHDYFPHGGFLFGAYLDAPKILATLPRADWAVLTDSGKTQLERAQAAITIIEQYILATERQGEVAMYTPAPNPPALFDAAGNRILPPPALDAKAMMDSLRNFDIANLAVPSLFPHEESFARGSWGARFLDIPVGKAEFSAQPANASGPARFAFSAQVPLNSWIAPFLDSATISGSLTGEPQLNISEGFAARKADLATITSRTPASVAAAKLAEFVRSFYMELPRGEIRVNVNSVRIPEPLDDYITASGAGEFAAYTPNFDPNANPAAGMAASVRKNGGIYIKANLQLGPFLPSPATELAVVPRENGLPHLTGSFTLNSLTLPGIGVQVDPVQVTVNSDPGTGPVVSATTGVKAAWSVPLRSYAWAGAPPSSLTVPAGARISIADAVASFSFQSGGSEVSLLLDFSNPAKPEASFNGIVEIDPFITGALKVVPLNYPAQTKLRATATGNTLRVSGAKLVVMDPLSPTQEKSVTLSDFTVNSDGSFGPVEITAGTLVLGKITFQNLGLRISANASRVLTVTPLTGRVVTLPPSTGGGFDIAAGGTINSSGTFSFTGTLSGGLPQPSGFPWPVPVPASTSASVTLSQNQARVTFSQGFVSPAYAAALTVGYSALNPPTVGFKGYLELGKFTDGIISFTGVNSGGLAAFLDTTINSAQATVTGARLTVGAPFNKSFDLQSFTVVSSLAIPVLSFPWGTFTAGPFSLPGLTARLEVKVLGGVEVPVISGFGGKVPGLPSGVVPSTTHFPLTGGNVNGDGTFELSASVPGTVQLSSSLMPWNVSAPAGASLKLSSLKAGTNFAQSAEFTWAGASSRLRVDYGTASPWAPGARFYGTLAMGPFTGGGATLHGSTPAAPIQLVVNGGTSVSVSTARFTLPGPFGVAAGSPRQVPAFTVSASQSPRPPALNFSLPQLSLGPFNMADVTWIAQVDAAGALSLSLFSARLPQLPGFTTAPSPPAIVLNSGSVDAGGNWEFTGTLPSGLGLQKPAAISWPVTIPDGSAIRLRPNLAVITLPTPPGAPAAPVITGIYPAGGGAPAFSFSGAFELPPFNTGVIAVEGTAETGAKLLATLNDGIATVANARVRIGGAFNQTAALNNLTLNANPTGFTETALKNPLPQAPLAGFTLQNVNWKVSCNAGVLVVSDVGATLASIPGFDPAPLNFTGGVVSATGNFAFMGIIPAQITAGSFKITGAGNASLLFTLNQSGLTVDNPELELGTLLSPFALEKLSVPSSGAFSKTLSGNLNLRGGFAVAASVTFRNAGGVRSLQINDADFQIPGGPFLGSLTGSISSSGALNLSQSFNASFFNFPLNGTMSFNAAQDYHSVIQTQTPAAHWKLDDAVQTQQAAADARGTHHGLAPLKDNSPAANQSGAVSAVTGKSFNFDGADDYLSVPDHNALDFTGALSVSAWFKVDAFNRAYQTIISKGASTWRIARSGSTSRISFDTNHTTSGLDSLNSVSSVNDGQWHHVAAIFDGRNKYLYLDGVLEAQSARTGNLLTNATAVTIGENGEDRNRYWDGSLDEVALWGRGLSAKEVGEQYASAAGMRLAFSGLASLGGTVDPALNGSIAADGTFNMSSDPVTDTILGYSFLNVRSDFRRNTAGAVAFTGSAALNLPRPASVLYKPFATGVNPAFGISFTRAGSTTTATLSASTLSTTLGGYASRTGGFNLSLTGALGSSPLMRFTGFQLGPFGSSELTNIGFAPMSGDIGPAGDFGIDVLPPQSLILRNMIATGVMVDFSSGAGLRVTAPFRLATTVNGYTHTWATATFTGGISSSGTYDLTGSASISFGNHTTDSFAMRFRSPDYAGGTVEPAPGTTPNLNFGTALKVEVRNLRIHQNSINYSMSKSGETCWQTRSPLPFEDYLYWVINFIFKFEANGGNGAIETSFDSLTDWKYKCTLRNDPWDPNDNPTDQADNREYNLDLKGGIGSDGKITLQGSTLQVLGNLSLSFPGWEPFMQFPFDGGSTPDPLVPPIAPRRRPLWESP